MYAPVARIVDGASAARQSVAQLAGYVCFTVTQGLKTAWNRGRTALARGRKTERDLARLRIRQRARMRQIQRTQAMLGANQRAISARQLKAEVTMQALVNRELQTQRQVSEIIDSLQQKAQPLTDAAMQTMFG
jgi:hypothetical protein